MEKSLYATIAHHNSKLFLFVFCLSIVVGCSVEETRDPYSSAIERLNNLSHCQDPSIVGCNLQVTMDDIRFFQKLTNIYSDTELTVLGPMRASSRDIFLWKTWLEDHKEELTFLNDKIIHLPPND